MDRKLALLISFIFCGAIHAEDPLPSWNETATKQAILSFIEKVTDQTSPEYVAPSQRIATFDNDGSLWSEQPPYFQFAFAVERIKQLAPMHPDWREKQPYKAVLEGDQAALAATGQQGLVELVMASHAGMTTEEFAESARRWLETARHPRFNRPYTELVYQPMLELLELLRANEFKTYIVSGGGIEFLRVFAEEVYGIPPEQVIGSSIKTKFVTRDGKPVLVRLPEIDFIDDKAGKPVAINQFIGQRPIFAAGNSDGDFEMLQWTTSGLGPRFGLLVHHDDAEREWAYDRNSPIGKLDRGLDEWKTRGWHLVSMRDDWKTIYPEKIENTD